MMARNMTNSSPPCQWGWKLVRNLVTIGTSSGYFPVDRRTGGDSGPTVATLILRLSNSSPFTVDKATVCPGEIAFVFASLQPARQRPGSSTQVPCEPHIAAVRAADSDVPRCGFVACSGNEGERMGEGDDGGCGESRVAVAQIFDEQIEVDRRVGCLPILLFKTVAVSPHFLRNGLLLR